MNTGFHRRADKVFAIGKGDLSILWQKRYSMRYHGDLL